MTLSELLTLLALGISLLMLIVTVIYDTIDIVLRLKELQTKNEQKRNDRLIASNLRRSSSFDMPVRS